AEARAAELRRSAAVRLRKQEASAPASIVPSTGSQPVAAREATTAASAASALLEEITEIREGDRVRIKAFDREGVVETINDGVFTVIAGSLRFRLKRDELHLVKAAEPPASKR